MGQRCVQKEDRRYCSVHFIPVLRGCGVGMVGLGGPCGRGRPFAFKPGPLQGLSPTPGPRLVGVKRGIAWDIFGVPLRSRPRVAISAVTLVRVVSPSRDAQERLGRNFRDNGNYNRRASRIFFFGRKIF